MAFIRARAALSVIAALAVLAGAVYVLMSRDYVVAHAQSVRIHARDFAEHYGDYLRRTGVQDTPALRRQFARDMTASRLLVLRARLAGIDEEGRYIAREHRLGRALLIDAYLHRAVWDTVAATEAEVRSMYVRSRSEVTARHLYAGSLEEAGALRERLLAGETFEELAKEVFRDPGLRETGGFLGTFSFDEMDAALEDAAFTLEVGEVSEPIRTAQGYSVVRVEDRFIHPLITEQEFAARRPQLEAYVLGRKRQLARRQLAYQILETSAVEFEEASVAALAGQIDGSRVLDQEGLRDLLGQPLVRFGPPAESSVWTVAEFRERAGRIEAHRRALVRSRGDLVDFVSGLVINEILVERAKAMRLDRGSDFHKALTEALDEYILDEVHQDLNAVPDVAEDSIRAYFDSAPPLEFMNPAAVFVDVAEAEGDRAWSGFASRRELGPWADAVLAASEGDTLGPLESPAGAFWVRVGRSRPAAGMSYEEARPLIANMLRAERAEARQREVYRMLEARFDIQIDGSRLMEVQL